MSCTDVGILLIPEREHATVFPFSADPKDAEGTGYSVYATRKFGRVSGLFPPVRAGAHSSDGPELLVELLGVGQADTDGDLLDGQQRGTEQ